MTSREPAIVRHAPITSHKAPIITQDPPVALQTQPISTASREALSETPSLFFFSLTASDASFLAEIHKKCFEVAWSVQDFTDFFTKESWHGTFGLAVTSEQTPAKHIGFILGRTIDQTNDILSFAIDPDEQGKGIGGKLLTQYLNKLTCRCILEVSTKNNSAIKVYENCGFQTLTVRRNYYNNKDDAGDAYIMTNQP